jgi:hypothetical protein
LLPTSLLFLTIDIKVVEQVDRLAVFLGRVVVLLPLIVVVAELKKIYFD